MKATINMVSPHGVPVDLDITGEDETQAIIAMMERADKIGTWFASKGWTFPKAEATGPSASELAQGPTFAGYPCSPTVDDRGMPTWILVEGKQAQRREKQGDTWYSVRDGESYRQVLRIPKGEQAPPVMGI